MNYYGQATGIILKNALHYQEKPCLFYNEDGQWKHHSWISFGKQIKQCAASLISAGIQKGDRIAILSVNMPEWTIADFGIQLSGAVSVPLYPTLSPEQAAHIIRETQAEIIFAGEQSQYDLAVEAAMLADCVKQIIVFDSDINAADKIKTTRFSEFLKSSEGMDESRIEARASEISDNDLYTIIYTSGTSGQPKGVMLCYTQIMECLKTHRERLSISDQDVSLCFLPLSHIFERGWTTVALCCGMKNYYLRNPRQVMDVMPEVKPTIMCAVPRFFEKVYREVFRKMESASALKRKMFFAALEAGSRIFQLQSLKKPVPAALRIKYRIADLLVLKKGRAAFGGRIRFMPCAGASIREDVLAFFHHVGIFVNYGYGLTETTATVSCYKSDHFDISTAGSIMPGVEVRIGENSEIQVKGPTVFSGYFKQDEETASVMDGQWFRTGDAGYIDANGFLHVTDRIKDIFKTSSGKLVAPQMVESVLSSDPMIENIAVIGDNRKFITALIVPQKEALTQYAESEKITFKTFKELCQHPSINQHFRDRIDKRQKSLSAYEQVKKFTLLPEEFSIPGGQLTSTLKLKRKAIESRYADVIEMMYLDN